MGNHPAVAFLLRHGKALAIAVGLGVAFAPVLGAALAGWQWPWALAGVGAGAFAGFLVRVLADLARLVVDMLLPDEASDPAAADLAPGPRADEAADVDLIVVGGGLAGLTTACRAVELGLKPLVLEQGQAADYACNSRYSGGIFHVAFKDVAKPAEEIAAAVAAAGPVDDAIGAQAIMAEDAGRAFAWLRQGRASFIKGGQPEFMRWMLAPPRPRGAGLDWKGRGPDVLLGRLTAVLEAAGVAPMRGWRAVEPILQAGRVAGVVAEGPSGKQAFRARAVVIADGGFQADMELMRRYVSPAPEKLLQRGAATGRGDGVRLAEAAGAALVGMDSFYGHLLGRDALSNEKLWPYPIVDPIARTAILVDAAGRRFTDEGQNDVAMANAVARLEDPQSAVVVFYEDVWTGVAADNRYPPCMNPVYEQAGGRVFAAGTLAKLADAVGVDVDRLQDTVAAWNAAVDAGRCGDLAPPRTTAAFEPAPIRKPPFRAIPVIAGITYTIGGIAIDAHARALSPDGRPVSGLFAAGAATGGIEGGPAAAYLGGLAKAVITGLRAAEAIANANDDGRERT